MKNMFGSCGCLALAAGLALAVSFPVAAQSNAGSSKPAASDDSVWNKYSIGVYGGEQWWRLSNDPNNSSNGHLVPGPAAVAALALQHGGFRRPQWPDLYWPDVLLYPSFEECTALPDLWAGL